MSQLLETEGAMVETTRLTASMRHSLEIRLSDLIARIESLEGQRQADDSAETTVLVLELTRERDDIADALRDAKLIDDEPFDTHAIEVGDVVTIRAADGDTDRYVLVDGKAGSRARNDWVSVVSPLGAAILGRSTGDRVEVESPMGPAVYEILDFRRSSQDSFGRSDAARTVMDVAPAYLPSEAFLG